MTKSELAKLIEPFVVAEGYELVECSVSRKPRGQTFRVSIDREGGVTVAAKSAAASRGSWSRIRIWPAVSRWRCHRLE